MLYLDAIMTNHEILYKELMYLNERYINTFSIMRESEITEARLEFFWGKIRPVESSLCKEFRSLNND